MGDVELVNKCKHNKPEGLAWKQVIERKRFFGLIKYTLIEKECLACGATFLADTDGWRLLN